MALIFRRKRLTTHHNKVARSVEQLAIPIEVSPAEIARKKTLGDALNLCIELAGWEPKEAQAELKVDKAQWSRWIGGQEGIKWERMRTLQDKAGNDAPTLWMLHDRGYDLSTVRRVETEIQRENRLLREENAALRRVLTGGK